MSSWGSCGVIFCRLGCCFGPLGVVLGRSWGGLGGLEAALRRVDAPKAAGPEIPAALGSIFGPSWVPKKEPRRSPRRPKIDLKIDVKNDRVSDRS